MNFQHQRKRNNTNSNHAERLKTTKDYEFIGVHVMKKKKILFVIVILVVVLSSIWFFTRPEVLGNMTQNFNGPTTNVTNISFSGEANEKIKFSYKSNVEAGELDIVLYDSDGDIVYELDKAKALETYFTLEKTDTFTLSAEYSDFVGSYKIIVYKAD